MKQYTITPIGTIHANGDDRFIELDPAYISGLKALDGFSHLNILWWSHEADDAEYRKILTTPKPYKMAPDEMGIFATRSPIRPNPISLSISQITWINQEKGILGLAYIDAHDGTPVIDLKPYTPSIDRIEHPAVPDWCAHWPGSVEVSSSFAWEDEFLF